MTKFSWLLGFLCLIPFIHADNNIHMTKFINKSLESNIIIYDNTHSLKIPPLSISDVDFILNDKIIIMQESKIIAILKDTKKIYQNNKIIVYISYSQLSSSQCYILHDATIVWYGIFFSNDNIIHNPYGYAIISPFPNDFLKNIEISSYGDNATAQWCRDILSEF